MRLDVTMHDAIEVDVEEYTSYLDSYLQFLRFRDVESINI